MTENEFKRYLALGLCAPGVWGGEKEPVAYLYNGVRLPKIPVVEGYEFASIVDANGVYIVSFTNHKDQAYNTGGIQASVTSELYKYSDGQWVKTYFTSFPGVYPLVWTNYDLYFKDAYEDLGGTVCMYASAPVPVYE